MKTKNFTQSILQVLLLMTMLLLASFVNLCFVKQASAQTCTTSPTVIFGLTPTGEVRTVNTTTGAAGARLNPAYIGNVADLSNAMGYNPFNSRFYFFKRNTVNAPQEFVSYLPSATAALAITYLASSPIFSVVNLGCTSSDGLGYYCIDALGRLYYYNIALNSWTTITTNVRDNFGTTLARIIEPSGGIPSATSRIYGDMAFDGSGNLWILISGPNDYGVYKLSGPVSKTAIGGGTGLLTITQVLSPSTPAPGLQTIGGVAFNPAGQLFVGTNAPDNKLYRMETNYSLTYLNTLTVSGVGNDLASCNLPMFVLPVTWRSFSATLKTDNNVSLQWSMEEGADTKGYEVEYSKDGQYWLNLGYVDGNRNPGVNYYSYVDDKSVVSKQYYRVAKINFDGSKSFSSVKVVSQDEKANISIYPNPAQDILKVDIDGTKTNGSTVMVFDQSGRQVKSATVPSGTNELNIRSLSPGTYLIKVQSANGISYNSKFIKK